MRVGETAAAAFSDMGDLPAMVDGGDSTSIIIGCTRFGSAMEM